MLSQTVSLLKLILNLDTYVSEFLVLERFSFQKYNNREFFVLDYISYWIIVKKA